MSHTDFFIGGNKGIFSIFIKSIERFCFNRKQKSFPKLGKLFYGMMTFLPSNMIFF